MDDEFSFIILLDSEISHKLRKFPSITTNFTSTKCC